MKPTTIPILTTEPTSNNKNDFNKEIRKSKNNYKMESCRERRISYAQINLPISAKQNNIICKYLVSLPSF